MDTVTTTEHEKVGTTEFCPTVHYPGAEHAPDQEFATFAEAKAWIDTFPVTYAQVWALIVKGHWVEDVYDTEDYGRVHDAEFVTDAEWYFDGTPAGVWEKDS